MERGRLVSLDVFRGLTIAGMILVNNPGSWTKSYAPLQHAAWHGWTPTDLIFPFFLFIVGVAITFSLSKIADRKGLYLRIVRRALLIFACGMLLHWFWSWRIPDYSFRIPGVLQRIAVCYLFASIITIHSGWRGIARWAVILLIGYWVLLLTVHAPTYETGRASTEPRYLARECALPCYVDSKVFGKHGYKADYDPEGLLSTIPAIATTLLGVLAGFWLRQRREPKETALWMFVAGCLLFVAGYAWSAVLPVNKALWTSSYVLLTGGCALLFLAFCYWTVDGMGWTRWSKPFEVYGMNALFVFMLSGMTARVLGYSYLGEVTTKSWLYQKGFISWLGNGPTASVAFALANVLFWLGVLWILYRKKIFIKL